MSLQANLFEPQATTTEGLWIDGDLPAGLVLVPDFISAREENELARRIDEPSAADWSRELQRRVKHFGYRYDYKSRGLTVRDRVEPLPLWAAEIATRLVEFGYFDVVPDQLIINEYLPGQGIGAHTDRESCFGPVVASLSMLSSAVMDFAAESGARASLRLNARSMLILSGESRYAWRHSIPARRRDVVGSRAIERGRRLSLTFRTVILN